MQSTWSVKSSKNYALLYNLSGAIESASFDASVRRKRHIVLSIFFTWLVEGASIDPVEILIDGTNQVKNRHKEDNASIEACSGV